MYYEVQLNISILVQNRSVVKIIADGEFTVLEDFYKFTRKDNSPRYLLVKKEYVQSVLKELGEPPENGLGVFRV